MDGSVHATAFLWRMMGKGSQPGLDKWQMKEENSETHGKKEKSRVGWVEKDKPYHIKTD